MEPRRKRGGGGRPHLPPSAILRRRGGERGNSPDRKKRRLLSSSIIAGGDPLSGDRPFPFRKKVGISLPDAGEEKKKVIPDVLSLRSLAQLLKGPKKGPRMSTREKNGKKKKDRDIYLLSLFTRGKGRLPAY